MEWLKNSSSEHGQFDGAGHTSGATDLPVCLCWGVTLSNPLPGSAFLQSLCVGEMSQVSELGSCKEISAGSDIQSHRMPTRTTNEIRLELQLPGFWARYARALHAMLEPAGHGFVLDAVERNPENL